MLHVICVIFSEYNKFFTKLAELVFLRFLAILPKLDAVTIFFLKSSQSLQSRCSLVSLSIRPLSKVKTSKFLRNSFIAIL